MAELDALVLEYSHLKNYPREKDALHAIKKVASLVKPIMRARNWKVGTLTEFYPEQQNLLGLNVNKGQKICLRLRYPGDKNQFLPMEQVVDTMLHELSHIVHGPHDAKFNALWDQLRKEHESLVSKGYTGEGFLSEGKKLGGRRVPRDEARRIARKAAETRRTLSSGSGQRLGGAPVRAGTDIRTVIADAIERRNSVEKGCGTDKKSDKEIQDLADQASRNGFRTAAEEEEANDHAIAQAMWELVQEDQMNEYGESYIPSTPSNPTGNGGGGIGPERPIKREVPIAPSSPLRLRTAPEARQPPRHISRLVAENSKSPTKRPRVDAKREEPAPEPPAEPLALAGWTCPICTLYNKIQHLCCDACLIERPEEITKSIAENAKKAIRTTQPTKLKADTWTCHNCSTIMESKWWTCSTCAVMKQSSEV